MPVSSLIEIFLSITLGGCVGWITNAIAVNMLFKKYWKWGGVIEARYQEFITNMSQLVETDLVNGKTLLDEFNSEPFKAGVRQWIETILQKALPENSGAVRLEAIPGIETTIHQLIGLLETIEPGLFAPLFRELGNQQVKNLLSKKHYEYIIEKNVHTLMSDAETYQYRLRHIISLFLEEKRIRDLISERALRQIGKNCGDIIRNIDFSRFDEASNTAYEQFLAAMDIDRLISELEQTLKSMRFANFVNNPRNFSRELLTNLVEFTQTAEGQKVLCKIIDDFFTAARHVDLKVADVVNPSILGGIHRFCNEKMPGIIDKIIAFIRNTQAEIEAIVNTTVDEQLDKTLVGKIGKLLKNIFIENLAHTVDVIGRIIHAVEEHGQKAGEDISQRIITLLQTKTIGEIVGMIQDSGLVKAQSIVDIINFNLKTLPGKDVNMLDELLEKRIGDIFGSIPLAIIKTDWLPLLFTAVKQKYLFTDRFKEDMCPIVSAKIQEMAQIPLSDMFDIGAIPITLREAAITNALLPVWETLGAMKFKDILGEQLPKQVHITKEAWQALWENNKERELNQLYHAIQKDEIYTKVVAWILTIINQNLDTLLSGNISNVVEAELVKLQPREINDMVQDFMGKEMKSINILGAVLGALVGGVSAVAVFFMNLPKGFIWWMLGVYSGIFALVGIGTNWLAIKLLFRPYKALFKGARFPPFIGIVAARKPDFAKNFANFVKTRMLSKDAIQQQVVNNKEKIKKHIYDRVSESNYAVIDMLFEDESRLDSITHGVFLGIQTYITEHRTEIVETLAEKIKQLIAEGKLDEVIPEIQKLIVKKLRAGDVASLIHKMIQKEIAGKHLGTYHKVIERLSDMQLKRVLEHIINEASKNISVNSIKNLIYQYNKEFVSYIGSHAIVDLVGTTVITDFSQKINEPISRMLHDAIGPIVTHIEKQELNPDITLRNLFNGAIPKILDKNMGYMLDEICREIKKTKGTLITTIKGAMPFYTIPWKGQVEPIVTTLVDHELPDFLNRKRDYLWRIMETLLDNKLSQLGFNAQSLERETVERTIAGILDSPLVQEGVGKLLGIVITRLAQIPLSILLGFIQIRQIHDIIPPLEPLLATTISHVKNNISRTEVIDVIGEFIKTILLDSIKDIPIAGLLKDIELEKELRNVVSLLVQDQKVMTEIAGLVEDILFAVCRDPSFYDERTLQKDMVDFIVQLDQSHCWDALEPMVTPALKELFIKLNGVITNETKDQICDYLISAMIRGCVDNFDSIMGGIKVESVVERVIADMHPRSIETLFYKFAGAYFAKIILYGWIGFFGGILSYIISYGLGKFIK